MNATVKFVAPERELKFGKFKGKMGRTIYFETPEGDAIKCYLPVDSDSAGFWLRDCAVGNIIEGLTLNNKGGVDWTKPYAGVKQPLKNEQLL